MSKVTLTNVTSFQNDTSAVAIVNANMAAIQAALELLLSRDGTSPNQMEASLDMNSNRILNLPDAADDNEPAKYGQLTDIVAQATSGVLIDSSVTTAKLDNQAVTTAKLADNSVTSAKIVDGTIAAADLASDSVTTVKILNSNVTLAKLANIANNTVLGNLSGSSAAPSEVTVAALGAALSGISIPVASIVPFASSRVPSTFLLCDGSTVSRTTYSDLYAWMCPSNTVTFNVSSSLVLWTSHPIAVNDRVVFTTTGSLPSGIVAGTTYYARDIVAGVSFKLAATAGGSAISLSGSPTGTHTCQALGYGLGNGTTTFTLPDLRGEFLRGLDLGRAVDTNRYLGQTQDHQVQDHTHSLSMINSSLPGYAAPVSATIPGSSSSGNPNSGNHGTETRPRNVVVSYGIKY